MLLVTKANGQFCEFIVFQYEKDGEFLFFYFLLTSC